MTETKNLPMIGEARERTEARSKVTGEAVYADDLPVKNAAFAQLVTSACARGSVAHIDFAKVRILPGVLAIYAHGEGSAVPPLKPQSKGGYSPSNFFPLQDDRVLFDGQILAMIVAESPELARQAADLAVVSYRPLSPASTFGNPRSEVLSIAEANGSKNGEVKGDIATALKNAPFKTDAEYETSAQVHCAMELYSTTCFWEEGRLFVHEPSQWLGTLQYGLADYFDLDPADVVVRSPLVGGAFGGKGALTPRTILVAHAARELRRPVKLVLSRKQAFTAVGHRAETRHKINLGAEQDGRLTCYRHESWETTSRSDIVTTPGASSTTRLYACPNIETRANVVRLDRQTPGAMRSPPEMPFVFALECAMDELSYKIGMDPVELRLRNDTDRDPFTGVPFTSRSLAKCFRQGASKFGWEKRPAKTGSMRDGAWSVGWGCASTLYPVYFAPSAARVRLNEGRRAVVEVAGHEIGTGVLTILGQIAAQELEIPVDRVSVRLGDSRLPAAPGAGGSMTTGVVGSAVLTACKAIRGKLGGPGDAFELMDAKGWSTVEELAHWSPPGAGRAAVQALHRGQLQASGGIWMEGAIAFAFGAHFVEVRVDEVTGEVRVPRSVSAFSAGRIINERTARSQLMGGVIWGISSALREGVEIDPEAARYVNDNVADYVVAVNADIDRVEVLFVPEVDESNPLGAKGVGELGNVGMDAAISNAVFHATGARIRKIPIRAEDVLSGMKAARLERR